MSQYMTITSDKSKKITLLLCIFLGYIGIHDLYLGKIGSFLIKLITANWFCIGWLIDIVKIISGTYRDGAGQPIKI